jgi:hypothetical protein
MPDFSFSLSAVLDLLFPTGIGIVVISAVDRRLHVRPRPGRLTAGLFGGIPVWSQHSPAGWLSWRAVASAAWREPPTFLPVWIGTWGAIMGQPGYLRLAIVGTFAWRIFWDVLVAGSGQRFARTWQSIYNTTIATISVIFWAALSADLLVFVLVLVVAYGAVRQNRRRR